MKEGPGIDRLLWIAALPPSLIWLSVEAKSLVGVMVVALPWAVLTARHAHRRYLRRPDPVGLVAATTLCGALVAPLAVVLMSMKIALHVHPLPDFRPEEALAVIRWTPIGAVIGLLVGVGVFLLRGERPDG